MDRAWQLGWGWTIVLVLAARAAGQPIPAELLEALQTRARTCAQLRVQFDWTEYKAPLTADPFDRANWRSFTGPDGPARTFQYEAVMLPPHLRLHGKSDQPGERDVTRGIVDGIGTVKSMDENGGWSVTIRAGRYESGLCQIPVLTPLEQAVFDLEPSVADFAARGALAVRESGADRVVLAGERLADSPGGNWWLRAVLDPVRDMLPVEISAGANFDNGKIHWTMRCTQAAAVDGVHYLREAVLALSNTVVDRNQWHVYHFQASRLSHDPAVSKESLRVEIPDRNARILDEVNLSFRSLDGAGRIVEDQHWTPDERASQLESIRRSAAGRLETERTLRARRRAFLGIAAGSLLASAAVVGAWMWMRRHGAARKERVRRGACRA